MSGGGHGWVGPAAAAWAAVLWAVLAALLAPAAAAQATGEPAIPVDPNRGVFVLGSYPSPSSSSIRQIHGIEDSIVLAFPRTSVQIAYLLPPEMRGRPETPELRAELGRMLRTRVAGVNPGLLVVVDTLAWQVLTEETPDLFAEVPAVFSGVVRERIDPAKADRRPATGVYEEIDVAGSVDLIRTLQPSIERVVLVSSGTAMAGTLRAKAVEQLRRYSGPPRVEWSASVTEPQLRDELSKLGPREAALVLSFSDPAAAASDRSIFEQSWAVPVYTVYATNINQRDMMFPGSGHGALGGRVVSYQAMGEEAGQVAVRLLRGEDPRAIPPRLRGGLVNMVDDRQARRLGLSTDRLPSAVTVVNRAARTLSRYWVYIALGAAVVMAQGLVIATLIRGRRRLRRVQQALSVERERYRLAVGTTTESVWDWNILEDTTHWSGKLADVLGFGGTRAEGSATQTWSQCLHPDDRERVQQAIRRHLERDEPYAVEYRLRMPSGDYRWYASRGQCVRDASRGPVRMTGTLTDVTERVQAEQRLARSEERFRAMFEKHAHPMWVYDRDTLEIVAVNDAAVRKYGYSREEFLGKSLLDLRSPEEGERLREYMKSAPAETEDAGVWRHRTRDGREIDVMVSTSTVPWRSGRSTRLGTFIDVSDKAASDRLRDHQSRILERIASDASLEDILLELIRGVEQLTPGTVGSVMLLESDGRHVGSSLGPGLPSGYHQGARGLEIGPRVGSGTAMFTRQRVISSDIAHDPLWDDCRALVLPLGLRACWSEPIIGAGGEVFGSFGMYQRQARTPTASETDLIAAAARLAGIAIQRRRLERSLQDAEARFRALVEHNAIGIAQVDSQGRFMLVNARTCEILGRAPKDLIGRTFAEFTHPDDVAPNAALLGGVQRTGDGYRLEKRYLRPDGSVVWANVEVRVIRRPDGSIDYLISTIQDISVAREAAQALAQSEERYRRLLGDVRVIAWEADARTWQFTFVAGQAEEISGYRPDEWMAKDFWPTLLHPDDRQRAMDYCRAETQGGRDHEFEYRIVRRDGRVRWMRDLVSVEMDGDRARRLRGVMIDITRQKEAESELNQFFRLSPMMLCTAGSDGHFRRVNPAFVEALGYTEEELRAHPFIDFVHPEDRQPTIVEFARLTAGGRPGFFENRYLHADGEYRWIAWQSTHFSDTGLVYAAARDVTEERAAAEAIRKSEAKYRQIVETADEGIWVLDTQWRTTFVNARMAEMLGRRPDEMAGRAPSDFMGDGGRGPTPGPLCPGAENSRREAELRLVRADGADVWTLVRTNPIKDARGRFAGALAMVTDITARRQTEEALRRERRLFLDGPAVAWRWRNAPGWPVEYVSANIAQLGYRPDDFTAGRLSYADLVHPDDLERVAAEVGRHVQVHDASFQQEYRLRAADGRWVWLSDHTVVERGPDGAVTHFAGHTVDITARKEAEQVLSQQRREYATLVTNLPDLVFRLDRALRHAFVGGAVQAVSGRPPEAFIGLTVRELGLPEPLCDRFEALCREVFETGEQRVAEFDLEGRWVHYQLVPERDARGEVVTLLGLVEDITHQRAAAEALRASEERYRRIVETAQEGIWLVDPEWRTTFVNARMAEMIGLRPPEMLGRSILDFCDQEARREAETRMRERERGIASQHEFRLRHADGRDVWTNMRTNAVLDADGRFIGALAMVTDITERRAADQALRQSESTNRALITALPDLLFRVDAAGRYLSFQGPPELPLLAPPERFLGRTIREVLTPELAEPPCRALDAALSSGKVQVYEYQTYRNDRRRWWEGRVVPVSPDEALILVRDITQRREAEEALRDSQRRLSILINQAPIGVIVWNPRFEIQQWNPSAERIFGFPAREAIGRHADLIVPPEARGLVAGVWRDLMSQRGGMYSVNENLTNTGERIICEWNNTPLVGADGVVLGVSSFVQDVTERVMSERRQTLMMQELDHRVKNNMAAVISLAEQTGRTSRSLDEFQGTFMGRVRALSRMHTLLAASRWRGADLAALVRQTVEPYTGANGRRLAARGPEVSLPPRAAQSLAMTLNELATNATKHGALSTPDGRITMEWSLEPRPGDDPPALRLLWVERGGPPASPPARRGLGIDLIEGAISYQLGGRVEFRFPAEGLECELWAPIAVEEKGPPLGSYGR